MRNLSELASCAHVGILVCASQLLIPRHFLQSSLRLIKPVEQLNAQGTGAAPSMVQLVGFEHAALSAVVVTGNG
jgi:hypothetical protein